MLSQLTVSNFTLVEQLEIEFSKGMTVITGETGAGKSIMLDALGLSLGDRSEIGAIGNYAQKAEVNATFDLADNPAACAWLSQRDLAAEQTECILRRIISKDGRSRGYINGIPSTVNDMKALGEILIDIHSQHEHQSLLKKETHRRLLDDFADTNTRALKVNGLYQDYKQHQDTLKQLIDNNEDQSARIQLLSYQAEELTQLNIGADEAEKLEAEQKKLSSAESILTTCHAVLDTSKDNDDLGIIAQLAKSTKLLATLNLEEIRPIVELLSSGSIQIEEAMHDLEHFSSDFSLDPARLNEVEDRLSTIYDLCRKHRIETNQVQKLEQDILGELKSIGNVDAEINKLEAKLERIRQAYQKESTQLSAARNKAAQDLTQRVSKQLAELGMSGARFDISLSHLDAKRPAAWGMEDIEFLISTNPGQSPKALNRIASGGELSRISLAIQVITADTSRVPTLIFDEVDVGIGGGIAEVVGALLRKLGEKAQIVCVTHLPQVAAQGHQHLKVSKASDGGSARTSISHLDDQGKIEEIARMLGGIEMTSQSLAHAQEMYDTAQA